MNFDSGVTSYVKAYAVIEVNFPIDNKGTEYIACKFCPYLSSNNRICQLNKEPIVFPDKFVGPRCPLIRKDDEV